MQLRRDSFATGRNGADGIRTLDPLVANQVLSQLSYRPEVSATLYFNSLR